jgi:hypothetical protein
MGKRGAERRDLAVVAQTISGHSSIRDHMQFGVFRTVEANAFLAVPIGLDQALEEFSLDA